MPLPVSTPTVPPSPRIKVWDRLVRLLHWTLVTAVATAVVALWGRAGWHQPAGWLAMGVVAVRIFWGCTGAVHDNPARFARFVRSPRATWAYARALWYHREPRYAGHNPLGGWMVLALMACVTGLALTGWLYTSDVLWGDERVELAHLALAWGLLALVVLHVAGVVFTSLRHHENLVRAMVTGTKRVPAENDRV